MTNEYKNYLKELNENIILYDELEEAFIGFTLNTYLLTIAIYDYEKSIEILQKQNNWEDYIETREYLENNYLCVYLGESTPVFINKLNNIKY